MRLDQIPNFTRADALAVLRATMLAAADAAAAGKDYALTLRLDAAELAREFSAYFGVAFFDEHFGPRGQA